MKIVIPMAGAGHRFKAKGYSEAKPLIRLACDNRRIIEHVLDMFQDPDDEFIFICNEEHIETTPMQNILTSLRPRSTIVKVPPHKKGPVFTLVPAFPLIDDEEEVIVSYCDGTLRWNRQDFAAKASALDGCLFTHTGFHPHTLSSTKMAFIKESKGRVLEVKEKAHYTDDPWSEHASSGVYYFKHGRYIKRYCAELIYRDMHHAGEFYVTLVYNLLIEDGLKVGFYDTDFVAILGTPEDVQNFEAWSILVKNMTSEKDAARCFDYWKRYWA
jgi:NDP-sugar pyrophosphorylase family protein